eukprot:914158-Prymnesium_polylepis.1
MQAGPSAPGRTASRAACSVRSGDNGEPSALSMPRWASTKSCCPDPSRPGSFSSGSFSTRGEQMCRSVPMGHRAILRVR